MRTFTDYERDPARLQEVRRTLAREIEAALQEPLLLLESLPTEDTPLVPAPTAIEFDGVTRPGATLTINGENVPVDERGLFHYRAFTWEDTLTARVKVETQQGAKGLLRALREAVR